MTNTQSGDRQNVWIEQPSFVFDCVVKYLRSIVSIEKDSLATLAMTLLFHNLGDSQSRDIGLSSVEDALWALPNISDSGMQIRDCLIASAYYFVAKETQRDTLAADHVVIPRINFAAKNRWFDDSNLAVLVALLADDLQVGLEANQYLRNKAGLWLRNGFVLGILHCCLPNNMQLGADVSNYLSTRDWSSDSLSILTWGLLALGRLQRKEHNVFHTQQTVAHRIIDILGTSNIVQAIVEGQPRAKAQAVDQLTSLDYALASYALNKEGFDYIIGVRRNDMGALNSLLGIQRSLKKGGVIVSKKWFVTLQGFFIGFWMLLLAAILIIAGVDALWGVLAEILAVFILSLIGMIVSKRQTTSKDVARALFGDNVSQDEAQGDARDLRH